MKEVSIIIEDKDWVGNVAKFYAKCHNIPKSNNKIVEHEKDKVEVGIKLSNDIELYMSLIPENAIKLSTFLFQAAKWIEMDFQEQFKPCV